MSTDGVKRATDATSSVELSELGKRIETIRIHRGISKQVLARDAATSRQQLWRVMTGKSELTLALRQRLSQILRVAPEQLDVEDASRADALLPLRPPHDVLRPHATVEAAIAPALDDYLAEPAYLEATLRTLPGGTEGRSVKRALLNALEDCAESSGIALPAYFFEIRRRVLAGEL